ncbi:MAG: hypothetical protein LBK60_01460 [Verrucomicrobiales bacterium]|jgi:hypothetical protein|nr:hypothetical protein [Verrucomicrobiales bacterium]
MATKKKSVIPENTTKAPAVIPAGAATPPPLQVVDVGEAQQTGQDPAKPEPTAQVFRFIKNFNPLKPVALPDGKVIVFQDNRYATTDAKEAAALRQVAGRHGIVEG